MGLSHIALRRRQLFFSDVFDGKQSNDSLSMPQSCFPEAELTTFAFCSGEVKKLLLELDPYGGTGPDGIFPLFFVKTANYLAPKISTVLLKLVRIGGFRMCWRVGNITPVPKSGSANSCPSDYRPIIITPVLSKVFEHLLAKRLNNFAEKRNLFPNLQFGFRKGLGTCDALLTITNFVQKALDSGCKVRMVGLDFSAAFDRVNHKAFVFKLRQLGVGSFLSILTLLRRTPISQILSRVQKPSAERRPRVKKDFFPKITARLVFKIKSSFFSPFLVNGYILSCKCQKCKRIILSYIYVELCYSENGIFHIFAYITAAVRQTAKDTEFNYFLLYSTQNCKHFDV